MTYDSLLINIDEIWLKGKNRRWYIDHLRNHILNVVHAYHKETIKLQQEGPKFFIDFTSPFSSDLLLSLAKVSGISSLQPCHRVTNDLEAIKSRALTELQNSSLCREQKNFSFKVESRRLNKKFPLESVELSRLVGAHILKNQAGLKVNMTAPDVIVSIRVLNNHSFITIEKVSGVGGVPVGTSGHAVTLISGGFDSPVASYLLFRRGLKQTFAFFHAYPFVGNEVLAKIKALISALAKYQMSTELLIVPFGPIQEQIGKTCKEEYRTLFFRQFMVRIATQIAKEKKALALVMGDSLSQVSSQTLQNIAVIDKSTDIPILRPLIGHNKHEIIHISRQIGTHDISTQPQDDACSLFAPKHPIIKGSISYAENYYKDHTFLDEQLLAIKNSKIVRFNLRGEEKIDLSSITNF